MCPENKPIFKNKEPTIKISLIEIEIKGKSNSRYGNLSGKKINNLSFKKDLINQRIDLKL